MSFTYDIRNLKDCADYRQKRKDFFDLLHLQQKLNKNYEQAMNTRMAIEELGILPTKEPTRSMEEERQDVVLQQQMAKKNLESLMPSTHAMDVISKLSDNDVYKLNSVFPELVDILKGRKNISSSFFMQVYKRFLIAEDRTGGDVRPIPLPESVLATLNPDLLERWVRYSQGRLNPITRQPENLNTLINETAVDTQQSVERIKELIRQHQQQQSMPSPIPTGRTPSQRGKKVRPQPQMPTNGTNDFGEEYVSYKEANTQSKGTKRKTPKIQNLPEKVAKTDGNIIRGDKRTADDVLLAEARTKMVQAPSGQRLYLTQKEVEARNRRLQDQMKAVDELRAQSGGGGGYSRLISFSDRNPIGQDTGTQTTPQEQLRQGFSDLNRMFEERLAKQQSGRGVRHSRNSNLARRNGKILGKVGRGISANYEETDKYREFGKYMVSMPSLRKGYLYVCYKSGMKINHLPRKLVSVDFIKMIETCLEEGVLDKQLFNKLSKEEQDYFLIVAKKCEFDKSVGLGVHRSEEETKLLDRFELLKGQIVAGNNAPDVLKELKQFVLKFMNDGTLNRQGGNQLLYEIACLG